MKSTLRRYSACMAMLGMLFAQLCLAGHACAAIGELAPTPVPLAHADCAGHSNAPNDPARCEFHCQVTVSVPSSSAAPEVALAPSLVAVLSGPVAPNLVTDVVAPRAPLVAMTHAPPIAIRYCRFLI